LDPIKKVLGDGVEKDVTTIIEADLDQSGRGVLGILVHCVENKAGLWRGDSFKEPMKWESEERDMPWEW